MKRHPRAFWVELVAELEAGAATGDVARRHKVRETTLRWWRTQLRRPATGPRLLPVVAGPAARAGRHVEIAVGDAVLRFEEGTDVGYVAALARAVGGGC
jgi:transposase-like protein